MSAITVDEFVGRPVEAVWAAITDPGQLAAWFMPNDFRPELGHRFSLDTGRQWGLIECEVTELDPTSRAWQPVR